MGLRLVNNTSRIVNINLPRFGISFILKQNESKPGLSQEYIDRMKDQINDFGLTVVDEEPIVVKKEEVAIEKVKEEPVVVEKEEVAIEKEEEVPVAEKEEAPALSIKEEIRRKVKKRMSFRKATRE